MHWHSWSRLLCLPRIRDIALRHRTGQRRTDSPSSTEIVARRRLLDRCSRWSRRRFRSSCRMGRIRRSRWRRSSRRCRLAGRRSAGWVAAIGTTEVREVRGRSLGTERWRTMPASSLPAIVGGVVYSDSCASSSRRPMGPRRSTSSRRSSAAAVFFVLNTAIAGGVLALRTGQSFTAVIVGDSRDTAFNNLALAPLGWLMALVYSIQWWATLLFALAAVHDADGVAAASSRCATCSPRRSGRWPRPSTSAIRITAQHSQRVKDDRGRHRAGDARQRRGARGARVGRPAPRRRQDRRAGRASC